jgi:membrane-associated HD superfamily phosphohydrolase
MTKHFMFIIIIIIIMLYRFNISTLYSRRKHLDSLFLINVFINKISCSSIFDTVSLCIPSRTIRDFSTFVVRQNFKVSPSARCVSAANTIYKEIDIFNKDKITLVDI